MGLFRRAASVDPAELTRMQAEIESLRQAIELHGTSTFALEAKINSLDAPEPPLDQTARLDELATAITALDARVTAVSTELVNQLTELGHDIDALGARQPAEAPDDAALGEILDGQVRLASEQARYQIAFREDLARLAEQLRRPR